MKLSVNQEACFGCGACAATAEDLFELNDDGVSEAKVDTVPEDKVEEATDARDCCPTGAITVE